MVSPYYGNATIRPNVVMFPPRAREHEDHGPLHGPSRADARGGGADRTFAKELTATGRWRS